MVSEFASYPKPADYHEQASAIAAVLDPFIPQGNIKGMTILIPSLYPSRQTTPEQIMKDYPNTHHMSGFMRRAERILDETDTYRIRNIAAGLVDEYTARRAEDVPFDSTDLIARQLAMIDFFNQYSQNEWSLKNLLDDEKSRNKIPLDIFEMLLNEEAIQLNLQDIPTNWPKHILYQALLWRRMTSTEFIVTPDYNFIPYALGKQDVDINMSPAGQIQARDIAYDHNLNPFTVAIQRRTEHMQSLYGFLHWFFHEPSQSYRAEKAHVMMPDLLTEFAGTPEVGTFIQFEKEFPFSHDLLHLMLAAYSPRYLINSPFSPICLGGFKDNYLQFAKGLRQRSDDFELALAIAWRQLITRMTKEHPEEKEKHFKLITNTLQAAERLKKLLDNQDRHDDANQGAEYIASVVMHSAFAAYDPRSTDFKEIENDLKELELPAINISKRDVLLLLFGQGLYEGNYDQIIQSAIEADFSHDAITQYQEALTKPDSEIPGKVKKEFRRKAIEAIIRNAPSVLVDGLCKNVNPDKTEDVRTGARFVYDYCVEEGFWNSESLNSIDDEIPALSGIKKYRWISAMIPQAPYLKGIREKIWAMETVQYGGREVHPFELFIRQAEVLEADIDEYQFRLSAVRIAERLSSELFDRVIDPAGDIAKRIENDPNKARLLEIMDKIFCGAIEMTCEALQDEEMTLLEKNGEELKELGSRYQQFSSRMHEYMKKIGVPIVQAREDLEARISQAQRE